MVFVCVKGWIKGFTVSHQNELSAVHTGDKNTHVKAINTAVKTRTDIITK